jgi:hypothetical protein
LYGDAGPRQARGRAWSKESFGSQEYQIGVAVLVGVGILVGVGVLVAVGVLVGVSVGVGVGVGIGVGNHNRPGR